MRSFVLLAALAMTAACGAGARDGAPGPQADARQDTRSTPLGRASRTFQAGNFDRIELTGTPEVVVAVGGQPSVRADGDAADLDLLQIEVVDGSLRIGTRPGVQTGPQRPVLVHVTVPALRGAAITGTGDINIDHVEGQAFSATVGGTGDLDVRQLRVTEASFSVTGAGGIRASGGASRTTASLNGTGDLSLSGFETTDATVSLVGTGDIALRATGTAQVQVTGTGDVTIAGGARCTIARSGLGDVSCGNTSG
jgi:hypothetical protein